MIRLLRLEEVVEKISLSRATIYRRLRTDATFPRPRRCGPNSIRFLEHEIDRWIEGLRFDNAEVV